MAYCNPPNRFSSTNQPKKRNDGNYGPYLLPILKKPLNKEMKFTDPDIAKLLGKKGKFKDAIMLRLILNATQGENEAIKVVLDRLDGKVKEVIETHAMDRQLIEDEIELIPKDEQTPNRIEKFLK